MASAAAVIVVVCAVTIVPATIMMPIRVMSAMAALATLIIRSRAGSVRWNADSSLLQGPS
jgi:hypothetical protein